MDNSLLAVRGINHKYIVVERSKKKGTLKNKMKMEIYKSRLSRSQKVDSAEQKFADKMTLGSTALAYTLFGGMNTKAYQVHRALGNTKRDAATMTYLAGRLGAVASKSMHVRAGDRDIKKKYGYGK